LDILEYTLRTGSGLRGYGVEPLGGVYTELVEVLVTGFGIFWNLELGSCFGLWSLIVWNFIYGGPSPASQAPRCQDDNFTYQAFENRNLFWTLRLRSGQVLELGAYFGSWILKLVLDLGSWNLELILTFGQLFPNLIVYYLIMCISLCLFIN